MTDDTPIPFMSREQEIVTNLLLWAVEDSRTVKARQLADDLLLLIFPENRDYGVAIRNGDPIPLEVRYALFRAYFNETYKIPLRRVN